MHGPPDLRSHTDKQHSRFRTNKHKNKLQTTQDSTSIAHLGVITPDAADLINLDKGRTADTWNQKSAKIHLQMHKISY